MNGQRQTDRQTDWHNYDILTVWEIKPRTAPEKTYGLLMGPEMVTGPKTLQAVLLLLLLLLLKCPQLKDIWPIRFVNFSIF